jgi:hypothetical protein
MKCCNDVSDPAAMSAGPPKPLMDEYPSRFVAYSGNRGKLACKPLPAIYSQRLSGFDGPDKFRRCGRSDTDGHECCGRVKDTENTTANTNVKAMSASAGA